VIRPRQSGQAILLFVVLIVVAGGMLGLAIDGARLFEERRQAQSLADAAALGAAFELRAGGDAAALASAALADVRINGFRDGSDELTVARIESEESEAVRASVRRRVRTTLMAMFGVYEVPVVAGAAAALLRSPGPCVLALAEEGAGALVIEGGGSVRIECAVEVRSAHPQALQAFGDSCLSAASVRANAPDRLCVSPRPAPPTVREHSAVALPQPSCVGAPEGAVTLGAGGVARYWPGCFRERLVIDGGRAELAAGRYIFLDGLELLGGEITGRDVSLLVAAGPVEIGEEAWVDLRSDGREPLLVAASPGSARVTPAPGSVFSGALHLPARELIWRPNAFEPGVWNRVTAERIRMLADDDDRVIAAPADDHNLAEARPVLIQ
jgi:hypothetical protein